MSEMRLLVEDKKVVYNGLFRVDELYGIMRKKLSSRGYFIIEKKSQEDILEHGKQVYIEMEPVKTISDYDKGRMKILFWIKGAKDKVITIDGHKQKYQQGEVNLTFFAWHETDHKNKWEGSGAQFFLRVLMDKFVRHDQNHKIEDDIKRDCNQLADEMKSYLNMTRFKISHDMHPHKG